MAEPKSPIKRALIHAGLLGFIGTFVAVTGAVWVATWFDWGTFDPVMQQARAWPVHEMAVMLTAVSLLFPFALAWEREFEGGPIIGYYCLLWIPFFVFAPDSRVLGHDAKSLAILVWFAVSVVQCAAAGMVLMALEAEDAKRQRMHGARSQSGE